VGAGKPALRSGICHAPESVWRCSCTSLEGDPDQPLVTGCLVKSQEPIPHRYGTTCEQIPARIHKPLSQCTRVWRWRYNELRNRIDKQGEESDLLQCSQPRLGTKNMRERHQKIRVRTETHDSRRGPTATSEIHGRKNTTPHPMPDRKRDQDQSKPPDGGVPASISMVGTESVDRLLAANPPQAGQKLVMEAGSELTPQSRWQALSRMTQRA